MMGIRFTWANFQDSAIHSRIDRFLVSIEWIQKLKPNQWGLPRSISDHCPIMIAEDSRDWGPKPFRFMDAWLSNPKCMTLAKKAWTECPAQGWQVSE